MIHNDINLKETFPKLPQDTILQSYCQENFKEFSRNRKRRAILILPGGGYQYLSDREGEPIALRFAGYDIACFILKYPVNPNITYPTPFVETYAALAYIRMHSEEYHIDVDKVSLIGFSAGGHLAAMVSCYHEETSFAKFLNVPQEIIKVNGVLLSYPVISMKDPKLEYLINTITQKREDLLDKLSIENHITTSFPKTFIWQTVVDEQVNYEHSLKLVNALVSNNILVEYHLYPTGKHGLSLGDATVCNSNPIEDLDNQYNSQWVMQAIHFIKNYI